MFPAFRPSRASSSGSDDRFLAWKVRLFVVGAALAFAGMAAERRWLVWAGVSALVAALALRFLPGRDR